MGTFKALPVTAILALFIPFVCFALALIGAGMATGSIPEWDDGAWLVGSAWMSSGLVCWILGKFLNSRKPRITMDPETGQEVAVRRSHTFMFMEMQWTGVLYGLVGGWYLVKSLWT